MSPLEVKRIILNSFKALQSSSFIYMSVDAMHKFSKDTAQDKDGNAIVDQGKRGTIYTMEQTAVST